MEEEKIELIEEIGAEAGEEGKKAKKKIRFTIPSFLIYLPVILAIGGLGYWGYKEFFEAPKEKEEVEVAKIAAKKGILIPGYSLVVNLADANVPRFLKISMVFEVDRGITVAEVQEKEPLLKDAVIALLSSKTMSEIRGYEAQYILKEELISRLNAILETGRMINIYFTEFIIQ